MRILESRHYYPGIANQCKSSALVSMIFLLSLALLIMLSSCQTPGEGGEETSKDIQLEGVEAGDLPPMKSKLTYGAITLFLPEDWVCTRSFGDELERLKLGGTDRVNDERIGIGSAEGEAAPFPTRPIRFYSPGGDISGSLSFVEWSQGMTPRGVARYFLDGLDDSYKRLDGGEFSFGGLDARGMEFETDGSGGTAGNAGPSGSGGPPGITSFAVFALSDYICLLEFFGEADLSNEERKLELRALFRYIFQEARVEDAVEFRRITRQYRFDSYDANWRWYTDLPNGFVVRTPEDGDYFLALSRGELPEGLADQLPEGLIPWEEESFPLYVNNRKVPAEGKFLIVPGMTLMSKVTFPFLGEEYHLFFWSPYPDPDGEVPSNEEIITMLRNFFFYYVELTL